MSSLLSLEGKKGLIVGIANQDSIAAGIARTVVGLGAEVALTYLNDKARPHIEPIAQELRCPLLMPLDVRIPGQMDSLFDAVRGQWGKLDFLVHSIAYSKLNELHGRLVDSSSEGFAQAMDISCHSFVRMAHAAEPLMKDGGTMLAMSYYGAQKVVQNYDLMGPIKAALESCVRYLASELGPKNIRVHTISPGPMLTRAASGIQDFDKLMEDAIERSPLHRLATPDDVGAFSAFLISDAARSVTGNVGYVDAGYHVMG